MNIEVNALSHLDDASIVFLHWSEFEHVLYILRVSNGQLTLEKRDGENFSLLQTWLFPQNETVVITDFKDYPDFGFFGVCTQNRITIYDFEGVEKHSYSRENGLKGFQAKDAGTIFLKQAEYSGCLSLGVWDLAKDAVRTFDLESIGHYNWSSAINSDGTLLYGTFNAYECGACLHVLDFARDTLNVISDKSAYSHRGEINCYTMALNSVGDEYAYIADEDGAAYTLCHRSVYQRKPLNTVKLPKGEGFVASHFLCDRFILVRTAQSLLLIDPSDRSYKPGKEYEQKFQADAKTPYAVSNRSGKIVFLRNGKLQLAVASESATEMGEERKMKMKTFSADALSGKFELTPVGSFYPQDWDEDY